jgi:Cu(I)/Ag(I) efflux system membrane protein CusA/SilA
VVFVSGYDRSGLIERAIATLREKLVEESIIVALVTLLFLLHARSALVAILTLPIGILMAFLAMRAAGAQREHHEPGRVRNRHRRHDRRGHRDGREPPQAHGAQRAQGRGTPRSRELVVEPAKEVGPALFISLLIITLSFVPVFALEAQEGRLFRPLAWTKTLAMASAALLSITLVPVLMGLLIRGPVKPEAANPVNRLLIRAYRPVIGFVLRHRRATVVRGARGARRHGAPVDAAGERVHAAAERGERDGHALALPRRRQRAGQADPHPARRGDRARPRGGDGAGEDRPRRDGHRHGAPVDDRVRRHPEAGERVAPGVDYDSIVSELDRTVRTPGVANMWSMPIRNRLDMLATGIKTPVGIKVFGPDPAELDRIGRRIEALLPAVEGTRAVFAERTVGGRYLDVRVNREAAARYGMTVDDVQMAMMAAVGGMPAGQVIEGRERYSVLVRYPRELRDTPEKVAATLVATPSGAQVALGELASVGVVRGATLIKSENAYLNNVVYVDVRGRDVGGYVGKTKRLLEQRLTLPPGYRIEWSGQFEAMERADRRLRVVVPITLAIIFLLLYMHFGNVAESALVMLSLPFALVGGVWLMWLLGYHQSVATGIGFIALAGVAAETGVVMLLYLDHAYRDRAAGGLLRTRADVDAAVEHGAVERVRPKMMTVVAITAGLLPILWSHGTGADVMKRIAAPMVGGMVSSTILTLVVIPAIYSLWKEREVRRASRPSPQAPPPRPVPALTSVTHETDR